MRRKRSYRIMCSLQPSINHLRGFHLSVFEGFYNTKQKSTIYWKHCITSIQNNQIFVWHSVCHYLAWAKIILLSSLAIFGSWFFFFLSIAPCWCVLWSTSEVVSRYIKRYLGQHTLLKNKRLLFSAPCS